MPTDKASDEERFYDERLLQDIEGELQSLFGHEEAKAKSLLVEWQVTRPAWTTDDSWH